MRNKFFIFFFLCMLCCNISFTQWQPISNAIVYDTIWISNPYIISLNDGEACYWLTEKKASESNPILLQPTLHHTKTTISGNITYDYQYRSLIDTPFYAKDFQQHSLSVNMKMMYKEIYPLNMRFQIRKSNQPLFKDFADINLQFNQREFIASVRNKVINQLRKRIEPLSQRLPNLKERYKNLQEQINQVGNEINDPSILQKIIEAREKQLTDKIVSIANNAPPKLKVGRDSLIERSTKINLPDSSIIAVHNKTKEQYAMLKADIKKIEDSINMINRLYKDSLQKMISSINSSPTSALQQFIKQYDIKEDSLGKGYKSLLAIRQVSVGRSMVNYSELTAKNISITGVNVEYNPSWYAAVAIGFTDWQFRDFRAIQNKLPRQYLALGRIGWGKPDKSSIILTYFTGKRNLLAQYATGNRGISNFNVSGISVEGIYHPHPNHRLSAEIAKSSYTTSTDLYNDKTLYANWLNIRNHHNEAYSITYSGMLPAFGTSFQGCFQKVGKYYQSYAFYNSQAQQDAWNLQLDQSIKKWMIIRLGLQKNQYNLPMLAGGLKNDIIFKTFQATIHYKKWPVLMMGYYPSSQISFINGEIPIENRFYTLNFSVNHSYRTIQTYMNSSLVYTKFYNESTDSNFIYYNAKNIIFTQIVWLGKWSLQGSYSAIWQNEGRLNVWEATSSCKVSEAFAFNSGLKWNSLINTTGVMGYSAGCTVTINNLGALQAFVDKSYWPGAERNLLPNTIARLTFVKTF